MTHHDDETGWLVAAAQSGDATACEQLFERYLPRVVQMVAVSLGVRRVALPASAEDIAQEALIRAFKGLDRFIIRSPGSFAAWMKTIVTNVLRNHHRDTRSRSEEQLWARYGDLDLSASFFPSTEPSPSMLLSSMESNDTLEIALLRLPLQYREMLTSRYCGQMTYAELAQESGRTEASCRKVIQRARELLLVEFAKVRADSS